MWHTACTSAHRITLWDPGFPVQKQPAPPGGRLLSRSLPPPPRTSHPCATQCTCAISSSLPRDFGCFCGNCGSIPEQLGPELTPCLLWRYHPQQAQASHTTTLHTHCLHGRYCSRYCNTAANFCAVQPAAYFSLHTWQTHCFVRTAVF